MNLATPLNHQLLLLFLTSFQVTVAQTPPKAATALDSLIEQFIDQHSVILTSDELVGRYILAQDFWQEAIHLKDDGRFKITHSRELTNVPMNRGNWQVNGNEVLLTDRKNKETAYVVKYNGNVCLLTSSTIKKWKSIEKNLQMTRGRMIYNPFRGSAILYKKE
ncbi:MAG: hypothetical protein AAF223_17330 [Bacteroidota bacterium]